MNIYISRDGSVIGQFELPELIDAISNGEVLHSDQAWHRGLETLGDVCEIVPPLLPMVCDRTAPHVRELAAK